jgi:hemerythrin-like domain-containing protein
VGGKVDSVPELLNRLHKEHADFTRLLDLLDRQLALFSAGQPADYDTIGAILQYCQEYPDAVHHPKEDLVYGRLRDRNPALAAEVGDLEEDHRKLAEMTLSLSALIKRALAEETVNREQVNNLTRDFISRYRRHIEREEQSVFPAALDVLSDQDWSDIDSHLDDRDDPLFGEVAADYFKTLRDDIDSLVGLTQGD